MPDRSESLCQALPSPPLPGDDGRMIRRSDASFTVPSGFLPDGDRDLLAINGHHFELGDSVAPLGGDLA